MSKNHPIWCKHIFYGDRIQLKSGNATLVVHKFVHRNGTQTHELCECYDARNEPRQSVLYGSQ